MPKLLVQPHLSSVTRRAPQAQRNTMATMTITVGDAPSAVKKPSAPKPQLYSEHGVPKKEGDPPLGIAYDADGLPVPVFTSVRERRARSHEPHRTGRSTARTTAPSTRRVGAGAPGSRARSSSRTM